MLRIHFLEQWFALIDPAMEEAFFEVPLLREFADLPPGVIRLPDESAILRFRHLLATSTAHSAFTTLGMSLHSDSSDHPQSR
jgi:transposase, IS5 family